MLPDDVRSLVEAELGAAVRGHRAVGGGCIANAGCVESERGPFFVKWSRDAAARTFPPEATGLEALREAGSAVRVPAPIAARAADDGRPGLLLLEWVEPGQKDETFWDRFGRALAGLHRHTADRYGFDGDNFIGRLPQQNSWAEAWPDFFRARRLAPQVARARTARRWRQGWNAALDALYERLPDLLPAAPPASVLHGDLWSGNFLVDRDHAPVLVDPAAYFGHREADLAMTELFGGFDERFYAAYREAWPLESGYEERREVYNLYHLVNHLNHFGGGYAGSVEAILRRFG